MHPAVKIIAFFLSNASFYGKRHHLGALLYGNTWNPYLCNMLILSANIKSIDMKTKTKKEKK